MSGYEAEDSKIPFDLDDCVSVNLMTLKNVITFMMNKINKNSKICSEMVNTNHELRQKVAEMEKKALEAKTDVDIFAGQLNTFVEDKKKANQKQASLATENEKRVNKLDESINDMESKLLLMRGAGGGGAGADMKVFEIMIHKLRKEFRSRFITSEELEEREQSIMKEIEKVKDLESGIKENFAKLEIIKKTVDSAVDKKDFKFEIDRIQQNLRGLGSRVRNRSANQEDGGVEEPMIEMDALAALEDKISSIEESINALRVQGKSSEEKLKLECRELKLNKYDYTTGKELKQLVEKLSSRIEDVDKAVKA